MEVMAKRRVVVAAFGVLIGLSSVNHGVFEMLQGNVRVPGPFISAIGPGQQMWEHGKEMAFTVWPTYLLTGILAVAFGIAFIAWSVAGTGRRSAPWLFLLIYAGSFISGGGLAQTILVAANACLAFRLHGAPRGKPWRGSGRTWMAFLGAALGLGLFGLFLGVTGLMPGVRDADAVIIICLASVTASVVLFCLAFAAAPRNNPATDAR